MFLLMVALISVIVALVRKGSFANIFDGEIRAFFLFVISILLFIVIKVGNMAGVELITRYTYAILLVAYALLLIASIGNLSSISMALILMGALMNFGVIFVNGGKMPVSAAMLNIAKISAETIEASATQMIADSSTTLSILGGVIPIPLPSVLAEIISPGTVLIGVGMFGIIQNSMLEYEYYDDDEYDDDEHEEEVHKKRKATKIDDDLEDDETDDVSFGIHDSSADEETDEPMLDKKALKKAEREAKKAQKKAKKSRDYDDDFGYDDEDEDDFDEDDNEEKRDYTGLDIDESEFGSFEDDFDEVEIDSKEEPAVETLSKKKEQTPISPVYETDFEEENEEEFDLLMPENDERKEDDDSFDELLLDDENEKSFDSINLNNLDESTEELFSFNTSDEKHSFGKDEQPEEIEEEASLEDEDAAFELSAIEDEDEQNNLENEESFTFDDEVDLKPSLIEEENTEEEIPQQLSEVSSEANTEDVEEDIGVVEQLDANEDFFENTEAFFAELDGENVDLFEELPEFKLGEEIEDEDYEKYFSSNDDDLKLKPDMEIGKDDLEAEEPEEVFEEIADVSVLFDDVDDAEEVIPEPDEQEGLDIESEPVNISFDGIESDEQPLDIEDEILEPVNISFDMFDEDEDDSPSAEVEPEAARYDVEIAEEIITEEKANNEVPQADVIINKQEKKSVQPAREIAHVPLENEVVYTEAREEIRTVEATPAQQMQNTAPQQDENQAEIKTESIIEENFEEMDTDSPYIIKGKRIIENPYYKFRKKVTDEPVGEELSAAEESIMFTPKTRNPSMAGRPSFTTSVRDSDVKFIDVNEASSDNFEKLDMKIGEVQIRHPRKKED